jgi:hypothetical protein
MVIVFTIDQISKIFCAATLCYLAAETGSRYSDRLQTGRPKGRSSSAGGTSFSPLQIIQTGSGVYPACYPMGTKVSVPGDKAAGA